MANTITQLKTDIRTAFGANLDAATIADVRNAFVAKYPNQWQAFLTANSLTDTTANRNTFAGDSVFTFINNIVKSYRQDVLNAGAAIAPDIT